MCRSYDKNAVDQCTEDDAERVKEKAEPNFCDWFVATEGAFDPAARREHDSARASLDALFGEPESPTGAAEDPDMTAAEALFSREPKQ
jgi:hypothetical protein